MRGILPSSGPWRYSSGNDDSQANPKESGYQTNHDFDYARSTNGGLTWLRQRGVHALPISQSGENGDPNTIAEKSSTSRKATASSIKRVCVSTRIILR